jgi:type II restriction/modification system DNA methylase subunit YeeA
VIIPWVNSLDILRRPRNYWIIDFGYDMSQEKASRYGQPFAKIQWEVFPLRSKVKRKSYREYWWLHAEPVIEMRRRVKGLSRFLVTTTVSKYRIFAWLSRPTLPDHQLVAFARDDGYFFGVLHSRFHEVWALKLGTRLETRPRYTPTTCFETFPFPEPNEKQKSAIAAAAKELNELRENWLNPPEWTTTRVLEFPGSMDGPWSRFVVEPDERGIGTVHYPRLEARDEDSAKKLAKHTLTNLYNERPTWLAHAHAKLDAAVAAAYGFAVDLTDEQILENLLALNLQRAASEKKSAPTNKQRFSRARSSDEMI